MVALNSVLDARFEFSAREATDFFDCGTAARDGLRPGAMNSSVSVNVPTDLTDLRTVRIAYDMHGRWRTVHVQVGARGPDRRVLVIATVDEGSNGERGPPGTPL